jgi:hypothetical protein
MKRRKRQDDPETYMQQIWYLISVTRGVRCLRDYNDGNTPVEVWTKAEKREAAM